MADREQITVRFESTLDNGLSGDNLLLSGPVKVHMIVDHLSELTSADGVEALKSLLAEEGFVVAFVKDITGYAYATEQESQFSDSQLHRGAYFYFTGWEDDEETLPQWQEILLGTHSHPNLDRLNEFVSKLDENGNIIEPKKEDEVILQLPPLPEKIREKLLKKTYTTSVKDNLDSGEVSDDHLHILDKDDHYFYDWCKPDEKGRFANLDVLTHNELYRKLFKDSLALNLNEIDENLPENPVQLMEYTVNYTDAEQSGCINAIHSSDGKRIILTFKLPWEISSNDYVYIFDGEDKLLEKGDGLKGYRSSTENCPNYSWKKEDNVIEQSENEESEEKSAPNPGQYREVKAQGRDLIISIDTEAVELPNVGVLTILKVENPEESYEELAEILGSEENKYLIDRINAGLERRYVQGAVDSKMDLPRYYLTTNEEGELEWTNFLLPSQHFVYREPDQVTVEDDMVIASFLHTNYNATMDFPLLLVNGQFVFNAHYDVREINRQANDFELICKFPVENEHGIEDRDENSEIKLIIIRKTSAESIADTVAENYISKEDAINILSHGKLNLSDYVTRSELADFALRLHSHSQYSLKGHNHDYRYANYFHTHPELATLMYQITNGEITEETFNSWLEQLEDKQTTALAAFVRDELGLEKYNGDYVLSDHNVKLSQETIAEFNRICSEILNLPDVSLSENAYLYDVVMGLLNVFSKDTVTSTQVILDTTIPVKASVGGIKGGTIYEMNKTTLSDILRDLLNPYMSVQAAVNILRPNFELTEFEWYKGDVKVDDPMDMPYEDSSAFNIYFKIKLFSGSSEENKTPCECEYTVTDPTNSDYGRNIMQRAVPLFNGEEADPETGMFLFKSNCSFRTGELYPEDFSYSWKINSEDNIVYDNYGRFSESISELISTKEDHVVFRINVPDICFKLCSGNEMPTEEDALSMVETREIDIDNANEGDRLVVLLEKEDYDLEEDLLIMDLNNHMEIQEYFDKGSDVFLFGDRLYENYFYTLGSPITEDNRLRLLIKIKERE